MLANARHLTELLITPRVALGTAINDQLANRIITRIVAPGKAFVDVGAHIGSVSAEVMNNCIPSKVIMIEAIPEKAKWLKRRFPNTEVYCTALSELEGEALFFVDPRDSGYSSLSSHRDDLIEIKVSMQRLDSLLDRDDIDVIKIDVEGAELGVLRGGENVLTRCRPLVMFESGPQDYLGYTKEGMFSFLAEHRYQVFAPNRLAHTGGPMDMQGFLDSHEYPRRTTNYFAVPAERVDQYRARVRSLGAWT